jgi:hypothetical protein
MHKTKISSRKRHPSDRRQKRRNQLAHEQGPPGVLLTGAWLEGSTPTGARIKEQESCARAAAKNPSGKTQNFEGEPGRLRQQTSRASRIPEPGELDPAANRAETSRSGRRNREIGRRKRIHRRKKENEPRPARSRDRNAKWWRRARKPAAGALEWETLENSAAKLERQKSAPCHAD